MTKIFSGALILSIITLILGAAFAACSSDDATTTPQTSAPNGKPIVVATTIQITALTREVGGDKIDLTGIIPAGADPHEFEPRASDLTKIENANVILRHGMGLDDWLDDTLSAAHEDATTVTEGVVPLKGDEDGATVDDPHVWHDPANDKIMVENIAAALESADPANRAAYDANARAYEQKLDDTKEQVQAIINEIPESDRKLVTNHDAFGYFARAFGLTIVGAVIPSVSSGSEPSAKDTAALLDLIDREHVKAIFAETSVNSSLAATLASDAHVKIVDDLYGDSLGQPGSGADTVDGMLLANARKITDALK
ncbi:MAG: zinc ABC transporter substrate-binding protein [Chloroflexota bacterium]